MNVSFRAFQPAFGSAQDKRDIAQATLREEASMSGSEVTPDFNTLEGLTEEKRELFRMIDRYKADAARYTIEGYPERAEEAEKDAQECKDAIRTLIGPQFAELQKRMGIARQDGSWIGYNTPRTECHLGPHGETQHVNWMPGPWGCPARK
jgi:hypothetical protein